MEENNNRIEEEKPMSKADATNRKDSKDKHIICKEPSAEAEAEEENKDEA